MSASNRSVIKCGVRLDPPALVIIYEDTLLKNSNKPCFRKRTMPVRGNLANSSISHLAGDIRTRHMKYLQNVHDKTLEKMVMLLKVHWNGKTLNESIEIVKKEFEINSLEDLNKLDDKDVEQKKKIMDITFEKNQIKPGDDNFMYDVEVDFNQDNVIETCGWDSDSNDNTF